MTDDLVKRLFGASIYNPHEAEYLCELAAVRIEKLEAALRDIVVHCEVPAPPNAEALRMFARKALEGKDE